jgi:PAS domain S-box-containing protein
MADSAARSGQTGSVPESSALLDRVFESIPTGLAVYGIGADFPCLRHNGQFLTHLPSIWQERGSLAGLLLRDLCAPEAYGPTRQLFERALSNGQAIGDPQAGPLFSGAHSGGCWRLIVLRQQDGSASEILVLAPDTPVAARPPESGPGDESREEELPGTEIRYRAIWAATNDAMALSDEDGIVLAANPAYFELYGYPAERAIGHSFAVIFPAERRGWAAAEYHTTFRADPDETRFESTVQRQDGTQRIVESRVTFLEEGGRRVAMLSTIRDITERKAMEQALAESERRFRALVDLAPVGIFATDPHGGCVFVNPCWQRLTGLAAAAAYNGGWLDAVHPDDRRRVKEYWQGAVQGAGRFDLEFRFRRPDGQVAWVISQAIAMQAKDGGVTGYLGVCLDVSERREMEHAAQLSEVRYQSVIAALDAGIIVRNAQGQVTSANAAVERILGLSRADLARRSASDPGWQSIRPDGTPLPGPELPAAVTLRTGQPQRDVSLGVRKPDGSLAWLLVNAQPLSEPGSQETAGVVVSFIDMTAYHEAQDRLQASLAEKEVLLKEVHHRVKNNLQVIISLLRLQSLPLADVEIKEQFRDTQNRVRAMALVHEQLYGAYDLAHIALKAYIQQLAATVLRSYNVHGSQIALSLDIDPALELTIEIAAPLGLILTEIISNSVKYAFPGRQCGSIAISARHTPTALTVHVTDDGVGLPAGFDPQASPSLGLQMVQRLAIQLGGTIAVESQPGTRFELTIPLNPKE